MNEMRLRFCDSEQPDLIIGGGLHALGRLASGLGPVDTGERWLLQLCNDRRGIWMTVAEDVRGVHVNGRPVQHVAMLRAGDSIHVDGGELLLTAANDPAKDVPAARGPREIVVAGVRPVLRGIGGQHHGRSISLAQACRIGRSADADIRIEGQGIAEQHALIETSNGQLVLRDAQADVMVNGYPTRQAVLHAGDQVVFAVQHRFVVEASPQNVASGHTAMRPQRGPGDGLDAPDPHPRRSRLQRLPWLLVAAILLAAALSALLLFGAH